jgi:ATP synthase protein I
VKDKKSEGASQDSQGGEFRQYLRLSTLGIEIGIALAIGILIGWLLDRLFGTRPWFMMIFSLFGMIAGFRNIIRLARKDWDGDSEDGGDSS